MLVAKSITFCYVNVNFPFRVRSLKFVTSDVAVVDGESIMGVVSTSEWLMILKREGQVWRISAIRSIGFRRSLAPTGERATKRRIQDIADHDQTGSNDV
jgi:hypothetical protein